MTRVFKVKGDVDNFQSLLPDVEVSRPLVEMLAFNRGPKRQTWIPPPVYSPYPRLKTPDIWTFNGALVFPPKVVESLDSILYRSGEFLPLPYGDEVLQVLNLSNPVNCLDISATHWLMSADGRRRVSVRRMAFHRHRLPDYLFTVPESPSSVLCVEGVLGRADEFKSAVDDLGLTGLIFHLVWNSDAEGDGVTS